MRGGDRIAGHLGGRGVAWAALLLAACAAPARERVGPDRSRVPPVGPPPLLRVPVADRFVLPDGLRVRLVEYHRLPIVALDLVLDAGAVHDPAGRPGLASMTAAMLTEGTRSRSATRISDELGFLGASLGAWAGMDSAQMWASSLTRHLPRLLDLFADAAANPAFRAEDFARVQDRRLVSLLQERDQPEIAAARALNGIYWGDHPYGHWIAGTEESIRALRPADLAAFHARAWRPRNAELVVVGDVTRAEIEPLLARAFAGWTGEAVRPPAIGAPRSPAPRTLLVEKRGAPQTYVLLGMPGLPRAHPDYAATEVAFQILGAGGTASRLFRHLREEQGLTYGLTASSEPRRFGGTSAVAGSLVAGRTGEGLRALLAEIEAMRREPVSEEELRTARNAVTLALPAGFATAGSIAGKIAEQCVYGLPDDEWRRFGDAVGRVTAADVQRVARTWLDTSHLAAVLVGDPGVIRPQLAGLPLGPLEVRAAGAQAGGR